jgi:hypothetical protein
MAHGRAAGVGASVSPGLLRRSAALAQLRRGTPPAAVAERLGCTSSTWLYRLRGSLAAGKRP